jgi:hypothetical protein
MDHVRKVEMFHHGEFDIFAKAGAASVFYADALIGPRLPSLTYMLSFPNVAALEAAWDKFGADPEWKKLSTDPQFNLDPPTVSKVTSIVLRPLPYSQVKCRKGESAKLPRHPELREFSSAVLLRKKPTPLAGRSGPREITPHKR